MRTGRLRAGWAGAGQKLGLSVEAQSIFPTRRGYYGSPPRERNLPFPDWEETVSKEAVMFLMRNNVPYALFVEVIGPGFRPPAPVNMVRNSSFETQADFIVEVSREWATL